MNKLLAFSYFGLGDVKNAQKHVSIALKTSKKDADLMCLNGLIKKDQNLVKESLDLNPYQNHHLVKRAKKFVLA